MPEAAVRRRRGHGGSILPEANPNDNHDLLRYRYNREFKADRGRHEKARIAPGIRGGHCLQGRWGRWC